MTKIFVINELGFEYNDEYNYQPESAGGTPVAAFRDHAKALAKMDELQTNMENSSNIEDYQESSNDEDEATFPAFFEIVPLEVEDEDIVSLPPPQPFGPPKIPETARTALGAVRRQVIPGSPG